MNTAIEQPSSGNIQRTLLLMNNQINSAQLFETSNELTILHNEERYTLRLTKNGKLILTK